MIISYDTIIDAIPNPLKIGSNPYFQRKPHVAAATPMRMKMALAHLFGPTRAIFIRSAMSHSDKHGDENALLWLVVCS